jgi:predicted nucleic acid-binding protein
MIERISGPTVYLDANVFIYTLEGYPLFAPVLSALSDRLDTGELRAVTSELTLAETLVRPMLLGDSRLEGAYETAIRPSGFLDVVPVSREVLREAARTRAGVSRLRLPDAIHVATARISGCSSFLTNDRRLKELEGIEAVMLSDLVSR